eukprot:TRINITY_DN5018_c0_g1_i1.p1 TRINITY_DN5018_c0_g1~~TRINITY_DN5018_c0_g1_i1.p1  ORF type:complete len:884 (+),score=162.97 TRINITY_DN5018_c0_g1_i1:78-2654(+)
MKAIFLPIACLAITIVGITGQSFEPKCGPAVVSTGTSEVQFSYTMGLVSGVEAMEVQLTFKEWGAVGFRPAGTTGMTDLDIAAVSSIQPDNVTDCYATTFGEPEIDANNDLTYVSHSVSAGFVTTKFYRLLATGDPDDNDIPKTGTINVAWATGTGDILVWSKHTLKGSQDITLLPLDCTTSSLELAVDTSNPGYSYLRNTFSWDGVCQAGLTCKTIFIRLKDKAQPPATADYQCRADIPATEGSYSILNRFVPLNADGTCIFTQLQISGVAKQIKVEFSIVDVATSAVVSSAPLSVSLMLRSPDATLTLKKVMKVVVGSGDTQFDSTEFVSILSNRLAVDGSLIHVLGARPFTVTSRRIREQALNCQGGSSEVTWLLDDTVPSAQADIAYAQFLGEVTVASSPFSTELCGVTEAFTDWRTVDSPTPTLDQTIVFDASPMRYPYLRVSPWRHVCFNKRVCKTIILKFSDAATTAHYLSLPAADRPTVTVTTADSDTTVVGGATKMSSSGLFIFTSLTLLGVGDSTEAVHFTSDSGGSVTVNVELENIDESIIPILAYQMVFRTPINQFRVNETFQTLVGIIVDAAGITEALIDMGKASRSLSTSRTIESLASNYSYCGVETGDGTEWRWAVNCTTCDSDGYYSTLTEQLADKNGNLSNMLCGVDEITKIWVEIVDVNRTTPTPNTSDEDDNTPWWILLCLAFSLCCCGLAMFGYGLHMRKQAKERPEPRAPVEMDGVHMMPIPTQNQQFTPMRDSVSEPPAIQTAEDANDEIAKLQKEIDMLENQKGAMDRLAAEEPPDVADIPEEKKAGATPSQLKPFTAERIGPDGPVVRSPEAAESDIDIDIDTRGGNGGAPAQA